jgi:hypothetical protein
MGHPERMGIAYGWSEARFVERSATVTPQGAAYRNLCIGCDRFHEEVLGSVLEAARARRRAARGEPGERGSRRIVPLVPDPAE